MHTAVFSSVDYTVNVGGYSYTGSDIISMRLIRSSEALPIKGIVRSELILVLNTDRVFEPNSAVKVTVSGKYSMSFSDHYVSRILRKGNKLTIHALDRMKRLDCDFNDSLYNRSSEPFITSLLLADLANQAGFDGINGMPSSVYYLYYDDIHGKTCREILDMISENEVCVWYCTNDNYLAFTRFGTYSSANGVDSENTSKLFLHSVKGPFAAVYGVNSVSSDVFQSGSASSFQNILRIKGSRISSSRTSEIMSDVAGKSYQAYSCEHIGIYGATEGLTAFLFEGYDNGLVSCRTTVYFGGYSVYASAAAADICEDESDYDVIDYEFRKKIDEGKIYGCTVMTPRGVGFLCPDDYKDTQAPHEAEKYCFNTFSGGITEYEGVMMCSAPNTITKVSDNEVLFTYDGYSIRVTAGGEGDTRTNPQYEVIYNNE